MGVMKAIVPADALSVQLVFRLRRPTKKDPCTQIVYTLAPSTNIETTLRLEYILFGYMDLLGLCSLCSRVSVLL